MDLENKKIWIGVNPVLCAQVQKKLFKMGYSWANNVKIVRFTSATMLFLRRGELVYSRSSREKFNNGYRGYSVYDEIFPRDLGIDMENSYEPHGERKIEMELKELLGQIKSL